MCQRGFVPRAIGIELFVQRVKWLRILAEEPNIEQGLRVRQVVFGQTCIQACDGRAEVRDPSTGGDPRTGHNQHALDCMSGQSHAPFAFVSCLARPSSWASVLGETLGFLDATIPMDAGVSWGNAACD